MTPTIRNEINFANTLLDDAEVLARESRRLGNKNADALCAKAQVMADKCKGLPHYAAPAAARLARTLRTGRGPSLRSLTRRLVNALRYERDARISVLVHGA